MPRTLLFLCATLLLAPACGDDGDPHNQNNLHNQNNTNQNVPAVCGDGETGGAEECDQGAANSDTEPDACRSNCTAARCGDSVADSDESCDEGPANSDTEPDACRSDCSMPRCGDGVVDGDHDEECDCGDGTVPAPTSCDGPNSDVAGSTCSTTCQTMVCGNGIRQATEQCDASDLGGRTCIGLGFQSGTLACLEGCRFDLTGCVGCGSGVRDAGEQCDGSDLGGADCVSIGYDGGNLGCADDCTFDLTTCAGCGNGVIDGEEECDDASRNSDTEPGACRTDCVLAHCGDGVIDASEVCDDGNATDWDGCTGCALSEFQINVASTGDQVEPRLALLDGGRFVVTWLHYATIYASPALVGQRLDAMGFPEGAAIDVNGGQTTSAYFHDLACTTDATCVSVWTAFAGSAGQDSYARRFGPDGMPLGAAFRINTYTTGNQRSPRVAMAADGRFTTVWTSENQEGEYGEGYAQRFSASGATLGGEFRINEWTTENQMWFDLAMAADGRFHVIWLTAGADTYLDVHARRFAADGSATSSEFLVNTRVTGEQAYPEVASAPDGRFIVVWPGATEDASPMGPMSIFGQRYDATGSPLGAELPVNAYTTGNQTYPAVSMAADGRFVAVWGGAGTPDGSPGVFARRFGANGVALGADLRVHQAPAVNTSEWPQVAILPDGAFIVVWVGLDGDQGGIFAQRFDADGNALGHLPWP